MKKQQGMTLIELMVAIMLIAILTTVAVPAMQSMFGRQNLKTISKLFEQSIQLARAEAIDRGAIVRVVPTIANTNSWAEGWQLEFTNGGGLNEVIRTYNAVAGNPQFVSPSFTQGTPLQFRPDGQAIAGGTFTLSYPDCTGSNKQFDYQVMASGVMQKTVTLFTCP